MSDARQMRSDLMRLSGYEFRLQKRLVSRVRKRPVGCPDIRRFALRRLLGLYADSVMSLIPDQVSFDQLRLRNAALHIHLIIFMKRPVLLQLTEKLRSLQGLGTQDDPTGVAVESIAHGGLIQRQIPVRDSLSMEQPADQPFI